MEWWHTRRSVERVKRATERQRTSRPVIKTSFEKLRAARHCVIHAAPRRFSAHVSREDEPPSTSLWRRGWGLTCWRSLPSVWCLNPRVACASNFYLAAKKKTVTIFCPVYNPYQKAAGLLRLSGNGPIVQQERRACPL